MGEQRVAEPMTADDIRRRLWWTYIERWAVVFEVTGQRSDRRRIDALLVRNRQKKPVTAAQRQEQLARWVAEQEARDSGVAPSDGLFPAAVSAPPPEEDLTRLERLAIEIKVSRADFLNDIRDPDKQASWRGLAERHAYCVPAGLVTRGEVPAESGLMEVSAAFGIVWARKAPRCAPAPLPSAVVLDAFYRWSRADAITRGYDAGRPPRRRRYAGVAGRARAGPSRTRAGARPHPTAGRHGGRVETPVRPGCVAAAVRDVWQAVVAQPQRRVQRSDDVGAPAG